MEVAGLFVLANVLGGMTFFAFVFSPLVFVRLPAETAGPFIRAVFPWYFLAVALGFGLAALLLLGRPWIAALLAAMAALGAVNRQALMPAINRLRDRQLAGDAAAGKRFDALHRASVGINLVQMVAAAGAFVALAV